MTEHEEPTDGGAGSAEDGLIEAMRVVLGPGSGLAARAYLRYNRLKKKREQSEIFISYRRADQAAFAGRLYDHLSAKFNSRRVFMDVDAIGVGVNFAEEIRLHLARCRVLLAVIGSEWLNICDSDGSRRLDDSADFVRLEIATALSGSALVVPILVDGAETPRRDQLPASLSGLVGLNAFDISNAHFRSDILRLSAAIGDALR